MKLLEIDAEQFRQNFAHEPLAITHHLVDHPLLSLAGLADLADRLPEHRIEHNVSDLPIVLDGVAPRADMTPGEIVRTIASNGCWIVLKNIELDLPYKNLLDETLDEVSDLVSDREGGMQDRQGFVFLSAPDSVTPVHIDPEHNLLLQVRGVKDLSVGRFPDSKTEQLELERYYGGGHRNVQWLPEGVRTFTLRAGDGVYLPVHAPHFVRNGPHVSVSLSVTFFTPVARRAEAIHWLNPRLRRLRVSPRPPGERSGVDLVKVVIMRVGRKAAHIARGGRHGG
jgi:Cupin superfamily protein